jgi:hypothetical protein
MPINDQIANQSMPMFGEAKPVTRSYVLLVDETARMTKEDIASLPGPITNS